MLGHPLGILGRQVLACVNKKQLSKVFPTGKKVKTQVQSKPYGLKHQILTMHARNVQGLHVAKSGQLRENQPVRPMWMLQLSVKGQSKSLDFGACPRFTIW